MLYNTEINKNILYINSINSSIIFQIKSFVSSIPKCNVEELLAIESFDKREMQAISDNQVTLFN